MSLDPQQIIDAGTVGDDVSAAPLAGTRTQRIQRLQIGLLGLGSMVLLVGLANIILTSAQENQATAVSAEVLNSAATEDVPPPSTDPLADAGVVPELPVDAGPSPEATPSLLQTVPGDVPPPPAKN